MFLLSPIRIIVLSMALALLCSEAQGQEIEAVVQVDRSQINSSSVNYTDNLADEIESYLNDHNWTGDTFQDQEKIDVNIQVNLLSVSDDFTFDADIIVRSFRPIYNSTRKTTVLLYNDEHWTFNYTPNRGLVHDELRFDGLTTLLDYYAYLILGFDYDTFAPLGGSPWFSEAQNMVSLAQTASTPGWQRSANVPRNRSQLLSDLLNPNYEALRRASYLYHRQGLDLFLEDPSRARANVIEALKMLQKAQQQTTSNLLFDTFFDAKYREIAALFEDAPADVRNDAYEILSDIDPSHLSEYDRLQ